jgi:dephospho-CoA kinase
MMDASGISVCDADTIAHRLMKPDSAVYGQIVEAFGNDILLCDGTIGRQALGEIVFNDVESLRQLNAIVHPAVQLEIEKWVRQCEQDDVRMAAAVIPLLFEAGMDHGWDAIICVACNPSVQMSRLQNRGLDRAACEARVNAQMPLDVKVRKSDFTIWNDGSSTDLSESVHQVLKRIQEIHGDGRNE